MIFNNMLMKVASSILLLMPVMAHAEIQAKESISAKEGAESPEEPQNVIKLEDILAGKYSAKQSETEKNTAEDSQEKKSNNEPVKKPIAQQENKQTDKADPPIVKLTAEEPQNSSPSLSASSDIEAGTGWLYLGKFAEGQWIDKNTQTLALNNMLPQTGQQYSVRAYANVRQGYPSKTGIPSVVKVLSQGSRVKILAVHNSGKTGHYWARVEWF